MIRSYDFVTDFTGEVRMEEAGKAGEYVKRREAEEEIEYYRSRAEFFARIIRRARPQCSKCRYNMITNRKVSRR